MGRVRPSFSRATRGIKGKKLGDSSSSNPKTTKFRASYNNLNAIAKGAPSKKSKNKEVMKKVAKEAMERRQLLDQLSSINVGSEGDTTHNKVDDDEFDNESSITMSISTNKKAPSVDGSRFSKASFASIWSHCSNASFDPFFRSWNANSELHKETLAIIAGTTQLIDSLKMDQTDEEYCQHLMKIIEKPTVSDKMLTGAALALSFVMRQSKVEDIKKNYDAYYSTLSKVFMQHSKGRNKSLQKSLIRCLSSLARAAPEGKRSFEPKVRKRINILLRHLKLQSKVQI